MFGSLGSRMSWENPRRLSSGTLGARRQLEQTAGGSEGWSGPWPRGPSRKKQRALARSPLANLLCPPAEKGPRAVIKEEYPVRNDAPSLTTEQTKRSLPLDRPVLKRARSRTNHRATERSFLDRTNQKLGPLESTSRAGKSRRPKDSD